MRIEPFGDDDLSRDAFLGGRVHLLQPRQGYRAGLDPVLLAASIPARAGQAVLELGCGAGAALCCLGVRLGGLDIAAVEIQPAYAELARRNAHANGLTAQVEACDLADLPRHLKDRAFDHVLANPPYFKASERRSADDAGREVGLAGPTPLDDWVRAAARRLRPGGAATFILRAERLPEWLAPASRRLGSLQVWPLAPRSDRAARLVLLRGIKEGRAPFRLHAPLILHDGPAHLRDGEDYAPRVVDVLRHGAALPFPA